MKKVKNVIDIIFIPIKLLLIITIVFCSYEYLNKIFINNEVDYGRSYKALPNNSIDVLVLGSSDAQYSFVPSFFFEDTGLYSYVRGTPCQPLEISYEMLKDSLKTQKPKIVILEVFTAMPLRKICEDDVCYVTAQYQMSGEEKYNTINYLPEEKAKEYRNDFINYHNDWKTKDDLISLISNPLVNRKDSEIKKIDTYFGYLYQSATEEINRNYWLPLQYDKDIDVNLDQMDLDSLNAIYELCRSNNIDLILYKTPIDGITLEDQSTLHKVWQWAEEKNIKYFDFVSMARDMKFYIQIHSDSFHCNINGASMITKYISNYINSNYSLDHIHIDYLDNLYKQNIWWLSSEAIRTEHDPLVYLNRLQNTEDLVCVRYNPYNKKSIGDGLYNALVNIGCKSLDVNNNYYAVIKGGKVIEESNNPITCSVDNHDIVLGKESFIIDEQEHMYDGPISLIYYDLLHNDNIVIKNIDYIPFPWDYGEKFYMSEW